MNLDHFVELANAYGADLRRWPAEHQVEARRLAQTPEGHQSLVAAGELDGLLDASRPFTPSFALREQVLASAPKAKTAAGGWGLGWRLKAGLGAGLTSAGLAGIFAGFALNTSAMEPDELAMSTLATPATSTAFGPAPDLYVEPQED